MTVQMKPNHNGLFNEEKIKEALVDLYLSVKIRKNEDIDNYNDKKLDQERQELLDDNISSLDLIGYIQTSIEILMRLKNEQEENTQK